MAYRDELEAAQRQIESLRKKVGDLEERLRSGARVAELENEIEALEAKVVAATAPPPRRVLELTSFGPAVAVAAVWGGAFLLVTGASEDGAWEVMNLAVIIGVVATSWSWGRSGSVYGWLAATAIKVCTLALWMGTWWSFSESALGDYSASFYFFWLAAPVVVAVCLAEGLIIRWRLKQRSSR